MSNSKTKVIALFSAVILMLSGCNNADENIAAKTSALLEQTTALTENTEAVMDTKVQLSDFATEICNNCYFLEDTALPIQSLIALSDSKFVFLYSENDFEGTGASYISVMDLETGNSKEICIDENGFSTIAAISGHIAVMCANDGKLTIYNDELEKTDEHSLPLIIEEYYIITGINSELSEVHSSGNSINLIRIDDYGKLAIDERIFPAEDGYIFGEIAGSLSDDMLIVTEYNGDGERICLWDIKNGTKTRINPDCSPYSSYVIGNRIIGVDNESCKVNIYSQSHPNMEKSFAFPMDYSSIRCCDSKDNMYFVSFGTDKPTMKRYSLETGACTAEFAPAIESAGYIYYISEVGKYVVLMATLDEHTGIFVWEPKPVETEERDLAILTGADYGASAEELERSIETDYGIEIVSGEDAVRYFGGYAVKDETSELNIYNALQDIENVCSAFPVGFLEEMNDIYGDGAGISIYLTGRIIPDTSDSESISDAAAFTFLENEINRVIVIDITQNNIDITLAHELMHCIEDAIYTKGFWDYSLEMFERWEMLNPEDFRYTGTYTDENGLTTGYDVTEYIGTTYYDGGDMPLDSVYFVDGYATSYAKEDKARIFENIFFSETTPLPDYFGSVNMQLKSAYLCACIREAFTCLEGVEACWEKSIDSDYTLDYFKESYNLDDYYYRISLEAVG